LARVLETFRSCFTAPTFETFTALVAGLVAQLVGQTVCGMLTGAGLARLWRHCRAHRFFSAARWRPQQVGLVLAGLVVAHLLPEGAPVTVVADDTLFRRRARRRVAPGGFMMARRPGSTSWGSATTGWSRRSS
jgi:NhaP-type Na+/H+ or K+/H+ antiporter